jgi:hypothetical protein
MRQPQPILLVPALLVASILTAGPAAQPARVEVPSASPDAKKIAEAATACLRKIESGSPASWTVEFPPTENQPISVSVAQDGDKWARTFKATLPGGREVEYLRIVERDGSWFVTQQGKPLGKFRPYTAPLVPPSDYAYLAASAPRFIVDPETLTRAKFDRLQGSTAAYHTRLPAEVRAQLEKAIALPEGLMKTLPDGPQKEELRAKYERARRLLDKGVLLEVDVQSGMLLADESPAMPSRTRDFRWLDAADAKAFDTSAAKWEDKTAPLLQTADPNELVLLIHDPLCAPEEKPTGILNVLFDIKTGRYERVPLRKADGLCNCLLRDRKSAVVGAVDMNEVPLLRLFFVNLVTGENRDITPHSPGAMAWMMPVPSPDGKTVLVTEVNPEYMASTFVAGQSTMRFQLWLIDLKTGEAKKLGAPRDTAFHSWLPDGKGFILVDRKDVAMDKPSERTVARMDMDGKVTPIRPGDCPVLLADGKTILFEDNDRLWYTCDLAGGNVKMLADGLKGYSFPSPSPDGKRIMWTRYGPRGVRCEVIEIGKNSGTPITDAPGYWGSPAWR